MHDFIFRLENPHMPQNRSKRSSKATTATNREVLKSFTFGKNSTAIKSEIKNRKERHKELAAFGYCIYKNKNCQSLALSDFL